MPLFRRNRAPLNESTPALLTSESAHPTRTSTGQGTKSECPAGFHHDARTGYCVPGQAGKKSSGGSRGSGEGIFGPYGGRPAHSPLRRQLPGHHGRRQTEEFASGDSGANIQNPVDPREAAPTVRELTFPHGKSGPARKPELSAIEKLARAAYWDGYQHDPVVSRLFPDAFMGEEEFVAAIKKAPTTHRSTWHGVLNSTCGDQGEGNRGSLLTRLHRADKARWRDQAIQDGKEHENPVFSQWADRYIERAKLEKVAPAFVGVWLPPSDLPLGGPQDARQHVMLDGDDRAALYRYLGMAVPVRYIPMKGRYTGNDQTATNKAAEKPSRASGDKPQSSRRALMADIQRLWR